MSFWSVVLSFLGFAIALSYAKNFFAWRAERLKQLKQKHFSKLKYEHSGQQIFDLLKR